MPRSVHRLCRAPFYCLKQIARASHPMFRRVMRSGAFAFAEHMNYSLASRKTVAFAGGVSPRPYPAKMRYRIAQPYCAANRNVILSRRACGGAKNLLGLPRSDCNAIIPTFLPLSFRLSERQRTHGEISHIVRLFLQCTLACIHFSSLYIIPRRFLDCARAASCRGRIPCSARNDILKRGCRPRLRGLLKAKFAGGVSPLPYSANGRYYITPPYSADSGVSF